MTTTTTMRSRATTSRLLHAPRPVPAYSADRVGEYGWFVLLIGLVLAVALWSPAPAGASDKTLRAALSTWSHRMSLDARGISLSAVRRHPRRMTSRARHFRLDALRAQRAIAAQRPSSVRGRHAKRMAVLAFRDYAIVGRSWSLSGRARLAGRKPLAVRHARAARIVASRGSRHLVAAARLLS